MRSISVVISLLALAASVDSFAANASVLGCKAVAIKAALKAAKTRGNAQTSNPNPSFVSVDQDEDDPSGFIVTVTQDEECMANYTVSTRARSQRSRNARAKCSVTSVVQSDIDCG